MRLGAIVQCKIPKEQKSLHPKPYNPLLGGVRGGSLQTPIINIRSPLAPCLLPVDFLSRSKSSLSEVKSDRNASSSDRSSSDRNRSSSDRFSPPGLDP